MQGAAELLQRKLYKNIFIQPLTFWVFEYLNVFYNVLCFQFHVCGTFSGRLIGEEHNPDV